MHADLFYILKNEKKKNDYVTTYFRTYNYLCHFLINFLFLEKFLNLMIKIEGNNYYQ